MRIYISGKITGLAPDVYTAKFQKSAELIRSLGHEPVNPVEATQHLPDDSAWSDYMSVCLPLLGTCEGIYMQRDWKGSNGAVMELKTAERIGLNVLFQGGLPLPKLRK